MTTTEFWLAWLFNLRGVFGGAAVFLGILVAGALFAVTVTSNSEQREDVRVFGRAKWLLWRALPATLVCGMLASAPGPDDLWKLRVGLLKLDLASPENVQKVGGHVEEVVKALECKHLQVNCPVPEKEK